MAIAKDATISPGRPSREARWPACAGNQALDLHRRLPASPGNDPVRTVWTDAYAAGKTEGISVPGIGYMPIGGSDPIRQALLAANPGEITWDLGPDDGACLDSLYTVREALKNAINGR
jgi:hypothetical protein